MASIPQSAQSWSDGENSPAHGTAAHDRLAAFIKLSRYCGSALDEI